MANISAHKSDLFQTDASLISATHHAGKRKRLADWYTQQQASTAPQTWDRPFIRLMNDKNLCLTIIYATTAFIGQSSGSITRISFENDREAPVVLKGHSGPVTKLEGFYTKNDSAVLVSISWDSCVRLWDTEVEYHFPPK